MKHALLALLLLLLGAAVSLGVAWGGALGRGFGKAGLLEQYAPVGPTHHWLVHRWDVVAGTRIMSSVWDGNVGEPYNQGPPERLLSAWGRIDVPDAEHTREVRQIDEAWGFPLRAMACRFESIPTLGGAPLESREHILSLRVAEGADDRGRYVPMRPIWLGLGIDTVLYALGLMVTTALVRDGWRLLRRP